MTPDELTLRGTVEYAGDVAFGPVFRLTAGDSVVGPVTPGETVLITVLPDDSPWADTFRSNQSPAEVDVDFVRRGGDEPYATASFTGFVDAAMTSWELRDVRPAVD